MPQNMRFSRPDFAQKMNDGLMGGIQEGDEEDEED